MRYYFFKEDLHSYFSFLFALLATTQPAHLITVHIEEN